MRFTISSKNVYLFLIPVLLTSQSTLSQKTKQEVIIGNHTAVYDKEGMLLPWSSWDSAVHLEMQWYLNCPLTHGYPNFVWMTFMEGNYQPDKDRNDFIPATQNGMGIISYLKYYAAQSKKDARVLQFARYMGDYLVKESLTPDTGKYPRFTRSTGKRGVFPQPADAGVQRDRPYEIEPDGRTRRRSSNL